MIDFISEQNYYKYLDIFLTAFLSRYAPSCTFKIVVESQINFSTRGNKNIKYEYFLYGTLKSLAHKPTVFTISGKIKKKIAATQFNWIYEKVDSNKKFIIIKNTKPALYNHLYKWQIFKLDITGKIYNEKIDLIKKYDDIIDTILMLDATRAQIVQVF